MEGGDCVREEVVAVAVRRGYRVDVEEVVEVVVVVGACAWWQEFPGTVSRFPSLIAGLRHQGQGGRWEPL